jgi:hypothetical protein
VNYSKTLEEFYQSNSHYPPKEDKERLAQQTGLSFAQVNTWFNNRRKKEQYDKQFSDPQALPMPTLVSAEVYRSEGSARKLSNASQSGQPSLEEGKSDDDTNRKMSIGYLTE